MRNKKIYFCPKCKLWRGKEIKCPECKARTVPTDVPLKRGSYYYIPGIPKPLVAVTSVINEIYAKPALIGWAAKTAARAALANPWMSEKEAAGVIYRTKEEAGTRGKDVHRLVDEFIDGRLKKVRREIAGYIKAYQKFKKDIPHRVIVSEKIVYSKKYGYAGTLDRILKFASGELVLVDIKTGKYVYEEAGIQLSAYFNGLVEMYPTKKRPEKQMVLQLKPDGTYSLVEKNVPLSVFLSLKNVWNWQQTLSGNGNL